MSLNKAGVIIDEEADTKRGDKRGRVRADKR